MNAKYTQLLHDAAMMFDCDIADLKGRKIVSILRSIEKAYPEAVIMWGLYSEQDLEYIVQ
jgi:hypothetical protein